MLFAFQATIYTRSHEVNLCASKSSCNKGGNLGFLQMCVANSQPAAIPSKSSADSQAFDFFNYMCPHLAQSRSSQVCCDTPQLLQLKVLSTLSQLATFFKLTSVIVLVCAQLNVSRSCLCILTFQKTNCASFQVLQMIGDTNFRRLIVVFQITTRDCG